MSKTEVILYSLIVSAFASITIFEGIVLLILGLVLYEALKERKFNGSLSRGIFLYSFSTLISTATFYTRKFFKGVEEGLFSFIYFLNFKREEVKSFSKNFPKLLFVISLILIPVVLYKFYKYGEPKPIWGGTFEVGFFYALFSINTFLLFLKERRIVYIPLFLIFLLIVFLSAKRSMILAFFVIFYLTLFLLFRSKKVKGLAFWSINLLIVLSLIGGYLYLSQKDNKFKTLNDIILGKKELNYRNLNIISSGRLNLLLEGISIIKEDLEKGRFLNLLIGHGVRAGEYLPHKYGMTQHRYESIFVVSELVERGILGLLGILYIYWVYFKKVLSFRIGRDEDLYTYLLAVPLGL
ncbi:MAG: hypothetical protein DSY32_01465, partial [Aquifex sp.]